MNIYDTRMYPVPSDNPKVLSNNSSNIDEVANSEALTWIDRNGDYRKTLRGIEYDANAALLATGYEFIGDYDAPGELTFTRRNQVMTKAGEYWRPAPSLAMPYTTVNNWTTDQPKFVSTGDASLRTALASDTGATYVKYRPLGTDTVVQTTADYMNALKFFTKYGAFLDGVNDDGPAIRKALDDVPVWGGEIQFPAGSRCKVVGTIFIPQRIPAGSVAGQGVHIIGNNSTIIGDGTSDVFVSGTGTKSTVSLGGATNWGLGNELSTTIHYNSRIEGLNIQSCGNAIKLFNWIQGCAVERIYGTDFTGSLVWTLRCFYLSNTDQMGRPFRNDRTDMNPIFRHDGFNNTMSFTGIHGSGIGPDGFTHGCGIQFDGGVEGLKLGNGISFEACKYGVILKSIVYSLSLDSLYFELCDTAIKSIGANLNHLDIDNCRFNSCSTNLDVDNWINGTFGPGNDCGTGITSFGNGSTCDVYYPAQQLTSVTHTAWKRVPDNWVVPAGCQVHRNDMIFNNAVGYSAVLFRHAPNDSGNTGVAPLKYTGDCFNVGGVIPFCTINTATPGQLVIDTKIYWNPNLSAVEFDIVVAHSQTDVIAGRLSGNNVIFRFDGMTATRPVTAVQNGDYLRFVITGFGAITTVSGKVRIV